MKFHKLYIFLFFFSINIQNDIIYKTKKYVYNEINIYYMLSKYVIYNSDMIKGDKIIASIINIYKYCILLFSLIEIKSIQYE